MGIEGKHAYRFVYLRSEKWQNVRLEALAAAGGKCAICGEESLSNDAHHKFYPESFWDTTAEHLIILCRECHDFVHCLFPDCKKSDEAQFESDWQRLITGISQWRSAKTNWINDPSQLQLGPKALRDQLAKVTVENKELKALSVRQSAALVAAGILEAPPIPKKDVNQEIASVLSTIKNWSEIFRNHSATSGNLPFADKSTKA